MNKKYFWWMIALFLTTRLTYLTLLPIFNDEAIYINWGQMMIAKGDYFFSLYDGKEPLLMWIFGLFANIFSDPLFGARLVSILFGFLGVVGIYKLTKSYLVTAIYILVPIFLFYDRQALMESAITALGIWNLYYLVEFKNSPSYKNSLIIGIIWGFGLLIKHSFLIFIFSSLIILVINSKKYYFQIITMILSSLIIFSPIFFQKGFVSLITESQKYSFGLIDIIKFPVISWLKNIYSLIDISLTQLLGLFVIRKIKFDNKIYLQYFLLNIGFYILTVRTPNSRYLVPFLPTLFLIVTTEIGDIKKIILPAIYFIVIDLLLIFRPINYFELLSKISNFSQKDFYLGTFTSGYGVKEAIDFTTNEIGNNNAIVTYRADAGNPESSIPVYLSKFSNIKTLYLESRFLKNPDVSFLQSSFPIYFIARNGQLAGLDKLLIKEKEFVKPNGIDSVVVYKVITK